MLGNVVGRDDGSLKLGSSSGVRPRSIHPAGRRDLGGRAFALAGQPALAGSVAVRRWMRLSELAATLALLVAPTYQLLRWQRDDGLGRHLYD